MYLYILFSSRGFLIFFFNFLPIIFFNSFGIETKEGEEEEEKGSYRYYIYTHTFLFLLLYSLPTRLTVYIISFLSFLFFLYLSFLQFLGPPFVFLIYIYIHFILSSSLYFHSFFFSMPSFLYNHFSFQSVNIFFLSAAQS